MTASVMDALGLAEGVPAAEGWRLVEAVDPGLVTTWRAAQETFAAEEQEFHERNAAFQRAHCIPRHPVPSPHAKAVQEAEGAVAEALEELIASGQIVFAGYRDGQLDGDPQVIPITLLGNRRPRGSKFCVRGTVFHDVKLFPATALAAVEPEPEVEVPPATLARLVEVLAALFVEDGAWEKAGDRRLAELVIARDRRFEPHDGPAQRGRWSAGTLRQRIKEVRAEAKAMAGQENY